MFADGSIYNRTFMTPESLPHIIDEDEAVRRVYRYKGVGMVTIPTNFRLTDIFDEDHFSSCNKLP
jgi:pyruvate oxidase